MRIFISMPDQTNSSKTSRISISNCSDTTQLIRQICKQCKINKSLYIFRLKNEIINLRIIENWPLDIYNIKNGSWIILQETDMHAIKQSTLSSTISLQKIQQNQQQQQIDAQNNSFSSSSKNSFQSRKSEHDYNSYYQSQLKNMLVFVRENSLSKIAMLLKSQPSDIESETQRQKIYEIKNQYVLNEIGECGRNALHWAIHINSHEIVAFLLIKNADPTIETIDEYTPLQLAVVHRNIEIVKILLSQNKVDPNKLTVHGSALHLAAYHQSSELIKILLQHKANPSLTDQDGKLPVELSAIRQIKQIFQDHQKKLKLRLLKPNILKGTVLKVSSLTFRGKERVLLVNPFKGDMIFYKENNIIDHKLKLKSISYLQKFKDKSWLMDDKIHYLKIVYTNEGHQNKIVIGIKHLQILNHWISSIQMARTYVTNHKYVSKIQTQMQLVQLIDDIKNQIKIHKRQAPPKKSQTSKNKFSFFDLQTSEEPQQSPEISKISKISNPIKPSKEYRSVVVENYSTQSFTSDDGSDFRMSQLLLGSVVDFDNFGSPINRQNSNFRSVFSNMAESVIQQIQDIPKFQEVKHPNFRKPSADSSRLTQFSIDLNKQIKKQKKAEKLSVSFINFEFKRLLGSGTYGQVFLVKLKQSNNIFALKVLNKKKLESKNFLKQVVSGTNAMKKITHPFLANLHYSFQTPTNLYLALDYCPFGDLSQILSEKQKFSESTAKFVIAQAILAFQQLHSQNIIFYDLKPENILLSQDGYVKFVDFNINKENDFSSDSCKNPAYLAPETLDKKSYSFQTNIYGLGCILYEMIVGEPPFYDEDRQKLFDNIKNSRLKFPGNISKEAKSLLSGMLEREVSKRIGKSGIKELKQHQFFKNFNWEGLMSKKSLPPKEIFPESLQTGYFRLQKNANSENLKYDDQQYTETSMFNRIKGFQFSRE